MVILKTILYSPGRNWVLTRTVIDQAGFRHVLKVENVEINHLLVHYTLRKVEDGNSYFPFAIKKNNYNNRGCYTSIWCANRWDLVLVTSWSCGKNYWGIFHPKIPSRIIELSCPSWIIDFKIYHLTPTMWQLHNMQVHTSWF